MNLTRGAALFFGGAVLSAVTVPARAQTRTPLRIAVLPIENSAQAFYAQDTGVFAKAGITADIQILQNTPALGAAITANAIDIGIIDIYTLANMHAKGIPLAVIAPGAEYLASTTSHISALVVPANSPVERARDLNGKVVAVTALRSLSQSTPSAWIDQHGGNSSTIHFVEVAYPAMLAALATSRIDAAWVTEPFVNAAKKNGRVLTYGFGSVADHFLFNAFVTTPKWAHDNADLVTRFSAAIGQTAVWANKNPARSADILGAHLNIDPAVLATVTRAHFAESLTAGLMQPLIDLSAKSYGFPSFPAQDIIALP